MRVLFVNRYSQLKTKGGVGEFLHYLPLALKKFGIDPIMYHEGEGKLAGPFIMANGARYYTGPFLRPGYFLVQKNLQPLLDLCKQEEISLLHAQGTYRCGHIALQVYKQTGIPYIVTSHADIVSTNSNRMKRGKVRRRCKEVLLHASAVTHLTPLMAEISHEVLNTELKSFIIGNGIDLHSLRHANDSEKNFLLTLGRLEKGKGFAVLINVFAKLQKQFPEISMVVAGVGSLAKELQAQARNLNLNVLTDPASLHAMPTGSVIFPGYVTGDIKNKLFAETKMILFATQPDEWEEPFGIVQLEAMAAGQCLIASDSPTTRYLQGLGLQAALVEAQNVEGWVDQIALHLQNDSLRKEMGEANLQSVEQFDWRHIAKQYAHIYKKVEVKLKPRVYA